MTLNQLLFYSPKFLATQDHVESVSIAILCFSQVDKTLFKSIVHIAVIPMLESSTLHLMAVTQVTNECGLNQLLWSQLNAILNRIPFHSLCSLSLQSPSLFSNLIPSLPSLSLSYFRLVSGYISLPPLKANPKDPLSSHWYTYVSLPAIVPPMQP